MIFECILCRISSIVIRELFHFRSDETVWYFQTISSYGFPTLIIEMILLSSLTKQLFFLKSARLSVYKNIVQRNFLKIFLIFKLSLCSYRLGRIHTLHLYDPAIFFKRPSVAHLSWNLWNDSLKLNVNKHVSNRDGRTLALSVSEVMSGSVHLGSVKRKRQMIRSSQQIPMLLKNIVPFWIHLASLQKFLITWNNIS